MNDEKPGGPGESPVREKDGMITGAVLAGGKSLRFGRNKALQEFEGRRLFEWAVESLRPFCDPVLVVANDTEPYLDAGLTVAMDVVPHQGPLGGIHTALLFSLSDWVMVKATDMPFLAPALASLLIDLKEGFDAVVPKLNDGYEPLLALYNRRCLPAISHRLGSPDTHKVIGFFKNIRLRTVAEEEWRETDPEALSFRNINTPSDLAELHGIERS